MRDQAAQILRWYDGMRNVVPAWLDCRYLRCLFSCFPFHTESGIINTENFNKEVSCDEETDCASDCQADAVRRGAC